MKHEINPDDIKDIATCMKQILKNEPWHSTDTGTKWRGKLYQGGLACIPRALLEDWISKLAVKPPKPQEKK